MATKEIPASVGAKLLNINCTSIYYKSSPISEEDLACKEIIDHLHTDNPTWGARQMSAQLKNCGYHVGRCKARRYMNEMGIYPIYPKRNLSKRMQQAKVCPYLLRNAVIDATNQDWSIDITYYSNQTRISVSDRCNRLAQSLYCSQRTKVLEKSMIHLIPEPLKRHLKLPSQKS